MSRFVGLSHVSSGRHTLAFVVLLVLTLSSCETFDPQEHAEEVQTTEYVAAPASGFQVTEIIEDCTEGTQSSGALFEVCVPPESFFNGTLILYAHGFVFPQAPLALPDDALGGVPAKQIIVGEGFAYAASSYYTNGLVDPQKGLKDLRELIVIYRQLYGDVYGRSPKVILVGFSNGAFLSTVALEKQAGLFDGALASCGPIGEYHRQIEYYGDVLVLFQYFFPGVIEGGPDGMPQSMVALGQEGLQNRVLRALEYDADRTQQLFAILTGTSAIVGENPLTGSFPPLGVATPEDLAAALVAVLSYGVFPVNDAIEKLGGSPYGNLDRRYGDLLGPEFSMLINAVNDGVDRYEADRGALAQLESRFKTHGNLKAPLVSLHNAFDPIVPFWQETLYQAKLSETAADLFHLNPVPVSSPVGHCNFTAAELFGALGALQLAISAPVI